MKIYTYPSEEAEHRVKNTIERGLGFTSEDQEAVEAYLDDVKTRGDQALVEYTQKFDSRNVTADNLKVTPEEIEAALELLGDLPRHRLPAAADVHAWVELSCFVRVGAVTSTAVGVVDQHQRVVDHHARQRSEESRHASAPREDAEEIPSQRRQRARIQPGAPEIRTRFRLK